MQYPIVERLVSGPKPNIYLHKQSNEEIWKRETNHDGAALDPQLTNKSFSQRIDRIQRWIPALRHPHDEEKQHN